MGSEMCIRDSFNIVLAGFLMAAAFGSLSACSDSDELTPEIETIVDKAFTPPVPKQLTEAEREVIRSEKADYAAAMKNFDRSEKK